MTAPSLREAATMALQELVTLKKIVHGDKKTIGADKFDSVIESLRAALALPDAEPVAWAISYTSVTGSCAKTVHRHNAIGDYRAIDPAATSTPLYAAPQPVHVPETNFGNMAVPVERKPLTAQEIWDDSGLMSLNAELDLPMCQLLRFARAVESLQNIKGAA